MKNQITDVFFDLDHTLWDFDKNSILAFDKIFKIKYPTINTVNFVEIYAPINQACWKLYQMDKITHEELRYNRLKQSFDKLNYTISDQEIDSIAEDYINFLPENNTLFEGALELLEYLKPSYNLHIITNGFADVQRKKINNSGIANYFQTITNSEMAGVKKPNPIIFEFAVSLAKANVQNCIMIGDCIDADVRGAINYGMKAILFNDARAEIPENIKQINHLLELKKYL